MNLPLEGVRVLDLSRVLAGPYATMVLADLGADVIKVEHPVAGDPQRGLISSGIIPGGPGAVNYIIEQPNRGKRSLGLDISTDAGRELLYRLAATSDVFLTSFLPALRRRLRIDVEDTGVGIAPADLPHVFDRFYRGATARGRPGSGLGLAIVRQVAEIHGGEVTVEDAPGGGALFRLRLPEA